MDEVLTLQEVSSFLKISEPELRKLMLLNEIDYFEIGEKNSKRKAKRRFLKEDIIAFIKKRKNRKDEKYDI